MADETLTLEDEQPQHEETEEEKRLLAEHRAEHERISDEKFQRRMELRGERHRLEKEHFISIGRLNEDGSVNPDWDPEATSEDA